MTPDESHAECEDENVRLRKALKSLLAAQRSTIWPGQGKLKAKLVRESAAALELDPNLFLDRDQTRKVR